MQPYDVLQQVCAPVSSGQTMLVLQAAAAAAVNQQLVARWSPGRDRTSYIARVHSSNCQQEALLLEAHARLQTLACLKLLHCFATQETLQASICQARDAMQHT
jgi:hypothetical protein